MAAFAMWHGLSNPGVFQVAFNWFGLFVLLAFPFDTNDISVPRMRGDDPAIRKLKRRRNALEDAGLDTADTDALIRARQAELRAHISGNSAILRRERWREQVASRRWEISVESPLVSNPGANGGYRVSSIVNSKKFHDAFEHSGLPKSVSESAYRESGAILSVADGDAYEYMTAIDCRTGKVVASNTGRPPAKKFKTSFNGDEMRSVIENENSIVTIHCHPGNKPPSYRDVMTLLESDRIACSIVVGFDGSVWMIKGGTEKDKEKLVRYYNELKDAYADTAEKIALRKLMEEGGNDVEIKELGRGES